MSYWDYKKAVEAMSERDRRVWDIHRQAINSLGFAVQMAEQGATNSQCKYEENSDKASSELWEILTEGRKKA